MSNGDKYAWCIGKYAQGQIHVQMHVTLWSAVVLFLPVLNNAAEKNHSHILSSNLIQSKDAKLGNKSKTKTRGMKLHLQYPD